MKLIQVKRIWARAPHNAFTDLVHFDGRWWCVFREGRTHMSFDGALRVLSSPDGERWRSQALISLQPADLRDAKIVVTPDRQLMLSGFAVWPPSSNKMQQSMVWFSSDGCTWSSNKAVGEPNIWLWRTTWHDGTAYCAGYSTTEDKFIRLYKSLDGKKYYKIINILYKEGYPNEASLLFLKNHSCLCLLRKDPDSAQLGRSTPPYIHWSWTDLRCRLGGPHMICLPNNRIVVCGRLYNNPVRTSLCRLDLDEGALEECLALPSGGDTGYPGIVWHNDFLWVSYYSSHEEKTAIYLAKVDMNT